MSVHSFICSPRMLVVTNTDKESRNEEDEFSYLQWLHVQLRSKNENCIMRKYTRYTGTHGLGVGKARSNYAEKVYPGKGANPTMETRLQRLEHWDNPSTLGTCRVMEGPWHTLRDTVMSRLTLQKGNKECKGEGAAGTAISLGTKWSHRSECQ